MSATGAAMLTTGDSGMKFVFNAATYSDAFDTRKGWDSSLGSLVSGQQPAVGYSITGITQNINVGSPTSRLITVSRSSSFAERNTCYITVSGVTIELNASIYGTWSAFVGYDFIPGTGVVTARLVFV